ncbi:hypothetical protein TNCV_1021971 [Trichonephila clavipes]|nr:hypothetical protein TNCV_1021971 [Trichonephila clavipes]
MCSMVAQRLIQITPPAAKQDQLWESVEAAWSAVPQEHIQSIFESMPRLVTASLSNNGGYSCCIYGGQQYTLIYFDPKDFSPHSIDSVEGHASLLRLPQQKNKEQK